MTKSLHGEEQSSDPIPFLPPPKGKQTFLQKWPFPPSPDLLPRFKVPHPFPRSKPPSLSCAGACSSSGHRHLPGNPFVVQQGPLRDAVAAGSHRTFLPSFIYHRNPLRTASTRRTSRSAPEGSTYGWGKCWRRLDNKAAGSKRQQKRAGAMIPLGARDLAIRASINHEPQPLAGKVVSVIVALISACTIASLFG